MRQERSTSFLAVSYLAGAESRREWRTPEYYWSRWKQDPQSAAFNVACRVPISGRLDVRALHRAFDSAFDCHPGFRSVFTHEGGRVRVQVAGSNACRVTHTDVRALPVRQMKQCVDALARAHARQPFDLTVAPLLRAHLLKTSESDRLLLLCAHRIAADVVSLHFFVDAVFYRYAGGEQGSGHDGNRARCIHGPVVIEPRRI